MTFLRNLKDFLILLLFLDQSGEMGGGELEKICTCILFNKNYLRRYAWQEMLSFFGCMNGELFCDILLMLFAKTRAFISTTTMFSLIFCDLCRFFFNDWMCRLFILKKFFCKILGKQLKTFTKNISNLHASLTDYTLNIIVLRLASLPV